MSTKQGDAVKADGYGFNKADDMYGVGRELDSDG